MIHERIQEEKPHTISPRATGLDATSKALILGSIVLTLMVMHGSAHAQTTTSVDFPVVDNILCGFISYCKGKLAPMIAVVVITLSVVGHWLGSGKMWSVLLYVGLGLGLILGIGSAVANYSSMASSCLTS